MEGVVIALVEGHLHAIVLEGHDVSYLALGGELHAGGHVHKVERLCEFAYEAFGYLHAARPRGNGRESKTAEGWRGLAKIA